VKHGTELCNWCQGLAGRAARKRPAAALLVAKRPAAFEGGDGALDRIAAALERLAEARTSPPQVAGSSLVVPQILQPVTAAIEAADSAGEVATALGTPPGHSKRGVVFALVHGVLSVACPESELDGLDVALQGGAAPQRRADKFFKKHEHICTIALWSGVSIATVVQSLARSLRHSADLRARHGNRFLEQLAELWGSIVDQL